MAAVAAAVVMMALRPSGESARNQERRRGCQANCQSGNAPIHLAVKRTKDTCNVTAASVFTTAANGKLAWFGFKYRPLPSKKEANHTLAVLHIMHVSITRLASLCKHVVHSVGVVASVHNLP